MRALNNTGRWHIKLRNFRVIHGLLFRDVAAARSPADPRRRGRQDQFRHGVAGGVIALNQDGLRRFHVHVEIGDREAELRDQPGRRRQREAGFAFVVGDARFVLHLDVKRSGLARHQFLRVRRRNKLESFAGICDARQDGARLGQKRQRLSLDGLPMNPGRAQHKFVLHANRLRHRIRDGRRRDTPRRGNDGMRPQTEPTRRPAKPTVAGAEPAVCGTVHKGNLTRTRRQIGGTLESTCATAGTPARPRRKSAGAPLGILNAAHGASNVQPANPTRRKRAARRLRPIPKNHTAHNRSGRQQGGPSPIPEPRAARSLCRRRSTRRRATCCRPVAPGASRVMSLGAKASVVPASFARLRPSHEGEGESNQSQEQAANMRRAVFVDLARKAQRQTTSATATRPKIANNSVCTRPLFALPAAAQIARSPRHPVTPPSRHAPKPFLKN